MMPETRHRDDDTAPLIWRSLALRLLLAALPLWLTTFVLISNVGWPTKMVIALALAVSLAAPVYGLLLIAIVAPLGQLVAPLIDATNFRISEAVVLAFLGGWLLRASPDRRGPRLSAGALGWLLAAAIVASVAGAAWQLVRYPGELAGVFDQIAHLYFFIGDRIGVVDGARLLEGIGLAAATVMLFRQHPSMSRTLPAALAASAALAALSSVLLWRGIGSPAALERYRLIGYRVSGHVTDVNAAGSYFAMIACLALGMAWRERAYRRAIWLGLAGASGVGLWFSESRSALGAAAVVVVGAAMWAATSRFGIRARAATLAVVLFALLGGGFIRARFLETDPTYRGSGFREQFTQTSLRMIGARPFFGVGEGHYYQASRLFLSPQLAWTYGAENAHNFFLQLGGELGLVGLGLFVIWLGAPIARAARALACAPRDARLLGTAGGVMVFLITCVTGHPFLLGEVAYPFWVQFGLMTALAGSTLLNQTVIGGAPARLGTPWPFRLPIAAAAVAILLVSPAATARVDVTPPTSQAVDGFYGWEMLEDGTRYRWTGLFASLFVPADVTRVEVPIRLPTTNRSISPMGVEVKIAGADRGRTLVNTSWSIISLRLPDAVPPMRFKRIDLKLDRVWQPALYTPGSADMRPVGVQVGELRLVRE
jgi:O-antigen ligase